MKKTWYCSGKTRYAIENPSKVVWEIAETVSQV